MAVSNTDSFQPRLIAGALAGGALYVATYFLIRFGIYGLALFVILPIALGGLAVWTVKPKTAWAAAGAGALSGILGSLSFLLLGWEGAICIVMTWPIAVPLGALGGWIAFQSSARNAGKSTAAILFLLSPASVAWDLNSASPLFEVRTSIEIAAPPSAVWKNVVTFSDLPEPDEWFFKAGLAYPKRARIEGSGPGAIRYCEFSTGPFVEPIVVWDEPRLLRFRVTKNPAPMEEWSPYQNVVPKHLHGYLVSEQGQFHLTALPNGRTLLEGTTWYRHGLLPAQYWKVWSDAIIHRIHLRVLNHIRNLSEREPPRL